jgi:hypothetical protein
VCKAFTPPSEVAAHFDKPTLPRPMPRGMEAADAEKGKKTADRRAAKMLGL